MLGLLLVALIVNGEMQYTPEIKEQIERCHMVIAVDGGLRHCDALGIIPHRIVGDFDSVAPSLLEKYSDVEMVRLERSKDKTDLEAAIEALDMAKVEQLIVFGGFGGRADQALTHYFLLTRYPGKMSLETDEEVVFALTKDVGTVNIDSQRGQTISLLPFYGPAKGVVSHGLKWELPGMTIDKDFLGISNVCLEDRFSLSVEEGVLFCIINKKLIDLEMLDLVDNSSTGQLTY